jgi:hypothetical protein
MAENMAENPSKKLLGSGDLETPRMDLITPHTNRANNMDPASPPKPEPIDPTIRSIRFCSGEYIKKVRTVNDKTIPKRPVPKFLLLIFRILHLLLWITWVCGRW